MRMGIGFDVHEFVESRRLILGGIEIPYTKGLAGHSDADVLSHAVCDALLGASGEGDLGEHFPDTDFRYKDISSLELLRQISELVLKKGFQIENIDTIIIAEEPKLSPFKESIRRKLAETLCLSETQVNVKAKTAEGLGMLGRSEGIASYAIVSLVPHAKGKRG